MINSNKILDFIHTENASYSEPRCRHYPLTEAYTLGSKAIHDISTNLDTHVWKAWIKDGWIMLKRGDLSEEIPIIHAGNVTELDIAFDQSARPVIVFVIDGVSYMYRYEKVDYVTVALGKNIKHPRLILDDPIINNTPTSDIILGYTYDGLLCYSLQRDRYEKEYIIGKDKNKILLWRVGITTDGRIGFNWR